MEFNINLNIFEGDLCRVDGYGHLVWEVIEFSPTFNVKHKRVVSEYIDYTLKNVYSGEEIFACEEDLSLICRAKDALNYIRQLNKTGTNSPPKLPVNKAGKEKAKVKTKLTRKQKDDLLNELLDRYLDVLKFIKADGEITEHNQKQIDLIEAELKVIERLPVVR